VEAKQAPTPDAGADYHRRQQRDFLAQQVAAVEANPLARAENRDSQATPIPTECPLPSQQNSSAEDTVPFARSYLEETPDRSLNDPIPSDSNEVVCEAEPVADEPTSDSDSDSDVFARLSQAGIWKPSDQPADGEDGSTATDRLAAYSDDHPNGSRSSLDSLETVYEPTVIKSAQDLRSQSVAADDRTSEGRETEARERSDSANASATGDDIEAYMQRLLQRVRGDSADAPISPMTFEPVIERSPQTEVAVEDAEPTQETVLTESEYQPRSLPPEAGVNIAAMRAIGNDNRRKDILKHAQRSWIEKARTRLFASVGGLAVAFASFFYLDTNPEYAAAGLVSGFGVAGFWLWQALRCRKQFVASLRLESEQK
jgi:hypothetical protein